MVSTGETCPACGNDTLRTWRDHARCTFPGCEHTPLYVQDLSDGDLLIVGHVVGCKVVKCRAIVDEYYVGIENEGQDRAYLTVTTPSGTEPEVDANDCELVRKVSLRNFKDLPRDTDWMQLASCAADWMRDRLSDDDALDGICYMLGGKLHKYLPEAWLGGFDGLEAGVSR